MTPSPQSLLPGAVTMTVVVNQIFALDVDSAKEAPPLPMLLEENSDVVALSGRGVSHPFRADELARPSAQVDGPIALMGERGKLQFEISIDAQLYGFRSNRADAGLKSLPFAEDEFHL